MADAEKDLLVAKFINEITIRIKANPPQNSKELADCIADCIYDAYAMGRKDGREEMFEAIMAGLDGVKGFKVVRMGDDEDGAS